MSKRIHHHFSFNFKIFVYFRILSVSLFDECYRVLFMYIKHTTHRTILAVWCDETMVIVQLAELKADAVGVFAVVVVAAALFCGMVREEEVFSSIQFEDECDNDNDENLRR